MAPSQTPPHLCPLNSPPLANTSGSATAHGRTAHYWRFSHDFQTYYYSTKKLTSFPSQKGPYGGADLCFHSPQPDTSQSCKSTEAGLVCHVDSCLAPSLCRYQFILLGKQRHTCVWTTCPGLHVKRNDWDSNLRPTGCRSDALTTMPPRHSTNNI